MKCEYAQYPKCEKKAVYVLRLITIPSNQCQAHLLRERKCVCKEHAEYLCTDAPFKWENMPSLTVAEEEKRKKRSLDEGI